jgi:hypothetical protein
MTVEIVILVVVKGPPSLLPAGGMPPVTDQVGTGCPAPYPPLGVVFVCSSELGRLLLPPALGPPLVSPSLPAGLEEGTAGLGCSDIGGNVNVGKGVDQRGAPGVVRHGIVIVHDGDQPDGLKAVSERTLLWLWPRSVGEG